MKGGDATRPTNEGTDNEGLMLAGNTGTRSTSHSSKVQIQSTPTRHGSQGDSLNKNRSRTRESVDPGLQRELEGTLWRNCEVFRDKYFPDWQQPEQEQGIKTIIPTTPFPTVPNENNVISWFF